jgi:hypothetical protein
MKGRSTFTGDEAARIRKLLSAKIRSKRDQQKRIRDEIREMGFFISDFTSSTRGFAPDHFDVLVKNGRVSVTDRHSRED